MSILIDVAKTALGKSTEKSSIALQKKRINICEYCPHLRWGIVRSCGVFLKGGSVTHEGKEKKLCGCNVDDKVKYKMDGCPLEKW